MAQQWSCTTFATQGYPNVSKVDFGGLPILPIRLTSTFTSQEVKSMIWHISCHQAKPTYQQTHSHPTLDPTAPAWSRAGLEAPGGLLPAGRWSLSPERSRLGLDSSLGVQDANIYIYLEEPLAEIFAETPLCPDFSQIHRKAPNPKNNAEQYENCRLQWFSVARFSNQHLPDLASLTKPFPAPFPNQTTG